MTTAKGVELERRMWAAFERSAGLREDGTALSHQAEQAIEHGRRVRAARQRRRAGVIQQRAERAMGRLGGDQ